MLRQSLVHYIAPTAISITPNCNGTASDLAVYLARDTKIRVNSKDAGIDIDKDTNTYQEWTLTGRNRRLADSTCSYTIYARLSKTDKTNGYLVFVKQQLDGNVWKDKYPYVVKDKDSADGLYHDVYGQESPDYFYIRLGDVSLPVSGKRELTLDTGILGTDQYNEVWNENPDSLPMRLELSATIDDEDAGPTPYVYWEQSLQLVASLIKGWSEIESKSLDHWEIARNSGDAAADAQWPGSTRAEQFAQSGTITLSHSRFSDDFNGAVSATFTVNAWGYPDSDGSGTPQLQILKTATISIMAETLENLDFAMSEAAVNYDPMTDTYTPAGGVDIYVRVTDQRGNISNVTVGQFTAMGLALSYASVESDVWTTVTVTGQSGDAAIGNIPVSAFVAKKSVNVRLTRSTGGAQPETIELYRATIAFVSDGEDGTPADVWTIGNDGYWYCNGEKTNTKAEGQDGTGVEIKGGVDVLFNADKTSPSQTSLEGLTGMTVGDCYTVTANKHLYFYDGTTAASAANPAGWRDLGKFSGDDGQSSYMHIAYADDVTFDAQGHPTSCTGFTVTKQKEAYAWIGLCTNNSQTDPTTYTAYEWNKVEGAQGEHGVNTAPVFLYQRYDTAPAKPSGTLTYTFDTGVLSGTLGSWSQTIPATNGSPCWVIQATAVSQTNTDTIASTEWSEQRKLVEDGADADVWTIGNDGYWYCNGVKTSTKAEGEDGTGVEIKGGVDVLFNADKTSQSQTSLEGLTGMSVGDCYTVTANKHLYFYDGTTAASAANPAGWRDLGKFSGDDGLSSYMHIAYADDVTFDAQGHPTSCTGFTVTKQKEAYAWIGLCTNNSQTDPTTYTAYEWNKVEGAQGDNGNDAYSVYFSPDTLIFNQSTIKNEQDVYPIADAPQSATIIIKKGNSNAAVAHTTTFSNMTNGTETHSGDTINITPDGTNTSGSVKATVAITGGPTLELTLKFYSNLLGTWKQSVEAGEEQIAASKIVYAFGASGDDIESIKTDYTSKRNSIGSYETWSSAADNVDGSKANMIKKTTTAQSTADGVVTEVSAIKAGKNLLKGALSAKGWLSENGVPYESHPGMTEPVVDDDGWFNLASSSHTDMCRSAVSLTKDKWYVLSLYSKTTTSFEVKIWKSAARASDWSLAKTLTIPSGSQGTRRKVAFQFTGSSDTYLFSFHTGTLRYPQLESGIDANSDPTAFEVDSASETSSRISQSASAISLKVKNTGIDIDAKTITLNADKTIINGDLTVPRVMNMANGMMTTIEAGKVRIESTTTPSYGLFQVNSDGEIILKMVDKDGHVVVNLGGSSTMQAGSWEDIKLKRVDSGGTVADTIANFTAYESDLTTYHKLTLGRVDNGGIVTYYTPDGNITNDSAVIALDGYLFTGTSNTSAGIKALAKVSGYYVKRNDGIFFREPTPTGEGGDYMVNVYQYVDGKQYGIEQHSFNS